MAINGFSTCNQSVVKTYKVPGTNHTYLPVRAEIAPLLIGFATEFNELVERLDGYGGNSKANDCWGYACRMVRGMPSVSFHSGGLAIDLNATRHPLGAVNTFEPWQRVIIRRLCRKYGLRWGGDYSNRKDEMHFEVILKRAEALALVKRLQTPTSNRPTPKPTPTPEAPRKAPTMFVTRYGSSAYRLVTGDRIVGISLDTYNKLSKAGIPAVALQNEEVEALERALVSEK